MKTTEEAYKEFRNAIRELKEALKDTIVYRAIIKVLDYIVKEKK